MAEVILENVSKVFTGGVRAVCDASLTVHDKEFVVLVGPSGCGKTTLLRLIAGLEAPTGGKISIDGRLVNDVAPKDRDVAMVFQNYALYPHMTVYQNMEFGLRRRGYDKAEIRKRVQETAEMLDISRLLQRKPKALSGGERQRVAVGRAIVRKPKVFLLDEPLSNLDAKLRVAMRAELVRLHRRLQTSMVYVTHDQVEAMTMGDRIAVLDRRRDPAGGRPADAVRRAAQPVRRRVRRDAADEFRARPDPGAGRLHVRARRHPRRRARSGGRAPGRLCGARGGARHPAGGPLAGGTGRGGCLEPAGGSCRADGIGDLGLSLRRRPDPHRARPAAAPRRAADAERMIPVRLDMQKAHFYDPQTEALIV